jgi:hypothetical protein
VTALHPALLGQLERFCYVTRDVLALCKRAAIPSAIPCAPHEFNLAPMPVSAKALAQIDAFLARGIA